MRRTLALRGSLVALIAVSALSLAQARERWLHVRVQDGGPDGERVSVNVPLQLIESLLPMIEANVLSDGRLRLDHDEFEGLDLAAVLAALRDSPDGRFVNVQGPDESVRVAKERGYLVVRAEERGAGSREADETVDVRLPLAVVEAMLVDGRTELDLVAGLRKLAEFEGEELISVRSRDEHVRVWIDASETGD